MNLLCLLGASDLAGSNSPDWLVGDNDLAPVGDLGGDGSELLGDYFDGGAGFTLLEGLAAAEDNADTAIESSLGLGGDEGVVFAEDDSSFRVAEEGPFDTAINELRDGDFTLGKELASGHQSPTTRFHI